MLDLAIVGAGSAGISAAREARRRGLDYTIFEASERAGGRARDIAWLGHHLDLGAGWLHSAERNPLVSLAEHLQLPLDRARSAWRGQYRELGFSDYERKAAYTAFTRFNERVSEPQPGDVAAAAMPPNDPWNAFIDALSGYLNGTSLWNMSAEDYAAYWDASTEHNWRLPSSYGALIAILADGLRIEHGFRVDEIDWDGKHVRLTSERGSIAAERAIVSVSTGVITSGAIRILPEVDDCLDAAAQLPLGHVEKMFFSLANAEEFPNDTHLMGNPHSSGTGSYMLRPMGIPVVEAFFGGDWIAHVNVADIELLARRELSRLLGSNFVQRIARIANSDWKNDDRFGGSYSFARPGQHSARDRLASPVEGRLAFAGEACSNDDFATVHGAWQSGVVAVERLFGPA